SRLNLSAGYWDIFWPQLLQGTSMGLLFVPLTTITNDSIPRQEMGNATSLFNLMRNIGASIGIAMVTTLVARHSQVHTNYLGAHVTNLDPAARTTFEAMKHSFMDYGLNSSTAARHAHTALVGMV